MCLAFRNSSQFSYRNLASSLPHEQHRCHTRYHAMIFQLARHGKHIENVIQYMIYSDMVLHLVCIDIDACQSIWNWRNCVLWIERCRQDSEDGSSSDSEDGGFSAHALASSTQLAPLERREHPLVWVELQDIKQQALTWHNLLSTSLLLFFLFTFFQFWPLLPSFLFVLSFLLVCCLYFPCVLFAFY